MRMDLYIHKDIQLKFNQEPKPGLLINTLLKKHYGLLEPIDSSKENKPPKEKDYKFCKHGSVIGFCKKGC